MYNPILSHHSDDMISEEQTCPRHCETLQLNNMTHLGRGDSYTNFHTVCAQMTGSESEMCLSAMYLLAR